jgi:putative methionine-R-sulfoxide reductase with GAF domain
MHDSIAPQQSLSQLLEELAAQPDLGHTLDSVVRLAVDTVPKCHWAGVTIRRGKQLLTPASTGAVVNQVDQLQYDLDEGPCIDAVSNEDTVVVGDMAVEKRWPTWAPRAHALGIKSSLSIRLATTTDFVAGLNLYSQDPDAFDDEDVQLAHQYAGDAAAILAVSNQFSTLQSALQTRHIIGMAQGILRHRHQLTVDQAFQVLVRVSRNNNVRLRDVAVMIVEQNGLPPRFIEDPAS